MRKEYTTPQITVCSFESTVNILAASGGMEPDTVEMNVNDCLPDGNDGALEGSWGGQL